jgi:hypothetical protein
MTNAEIIEAIKCLVPKSVFTGVDPVYKFLKHLNSGYYPTGGYGFTLNSEGVQILNHEAHKPQLVVLKWGALKQCLQFHFNTSYSERLQSIYQQLKMAF